MMPQDFIERIGGPMLGFVASFALFRSRFVAIEKDIAANAKMQEATRKNDIEMLDLKLKPVIAAYKRMERKQLVSLDILASLARHAGVTHRALGSDAFANALEDDDDSAS